MAAITLERVTLTQARRRPLHDEGVEVAPGEWLVLTGGVDSGAGELARVVAGIEPAAAGRVLFGERDVTELSPEERGVTVVGWTPPPPPAPKALTRLGRVFARRPPAPPPPPTLRSALADAGSGAPRVVVSIDALSHFDRYDRQAEWAELLAMHRRRPVTVVHVTPDPEEAMALAQRLAVLDHGRIVQIGPPEWLYDRPATTLVARALGEPAINLIHGRVVIHDDRPVFEAAGQPLAELPAVGASLAGRSMTLGIRPADLRLGGPADGVPVEVTAVEPTGPSQTVFGVFASGFDLVAVLPARPLVAAGKPLYLRVPPDRLHLFSATGARFFGADAPMARWLDSPIAR